MDPRRKHGTEGRTFGGFFRVGLGFLGRERGVEGRLSLLSGTFSGGFGVFFQYIFRKDPLKGKEEDKFK